MLYGQDRARMRRTFAEAWRKRVAGQPLEPLERQLGDVIAMHPEYHGLLEQDDAMERDFDDAGGAQNPFLHLGLHMALHEQLSTDRPAGVRAHYARLVPGSASAHDVEHAMMACLQRALHAAQTSGRPPDEQRYLVCLGRIGREARVKAGTSMRPRTLRR